MGELIKRYGKRVKKNYGSAKVYITHWVCLILIVGSFAGSIFSKIFSDGPPEGMIEHIALCFVAVVLVYLPVFARSRFRFQVPAYLHISITVFILSHFVLGEILRFYDHSMFFDKILHFTSGVVIAICGFALVYGLSGSKTREVQLSPFFIALFAFCFAMTITVFWEFFEYFMDVAFGLNMQRWKDGMNSKGYPLGLHDTMQDMLVATIGALIVCVIGYIRLVANPGKKIFEIKRAKREQKNEQLQPKEQEVETPLEQMVEEAQESTGEVRTQEGDA
jgi:uncharacterized membrane protein YjdF